MGAEGSSKDMEQILAIRRLWMRRWWFVNLGLWITVGAASFWHLRRTLHQLMDYFTWAAIKYGLGFNRPAAAGVGLCVGLTVALLLKEVRFQLFGLTRKEHQTLQQALDKQVARNPVPQNPVK